jgi:hypothetical protein
MLADGRLFRLQEDREWVRWAKLHSQNDAKPKFFDNNSVEDVIVPLGTVDVYYMLAGTMEVAPESSTDTFRNAVMRGIN